MSVRAGHQFLNEFLAVSVDKLDIVAHKGSRDKIINEDGTVRDMERKALIPQEIPVTVDLMATLRGPFGNYYFKYSPSHLVKDGWGLKFHTLSFGIFL